MALNSTYLEMHTGIAFVGTKTSALEEHPMFTQVFHVDSLTGPQTACDLVTQLQDKVAEFIA